MAPKHWPEFSIPAVLSGISLTSSKEIWKLSYEEAIKVMQEELENAMSEYGRFNDLLEESELYDESGVV